MNARAAGIRQRFVIEYSSLPQRSDVIQINTMRSVLMRHRVSGATRHVLLLAIVGLVIGVLAITAFVRKPVAPAVIYKVIDGQQLTTEQMQGKIYLVNFWATSCVTCVKEMPDLVATYEKFKGRGFDTVAVAMKYDPPNFVLDFVDRKRLPFKVALDVDGSVAKEWGQVAVTPTTFLVDAQGKVIKRYVGEPDFSQLHAWLDDNLPKGKS